MSRSFLAAGIACLSTTFLPVLAQGVPIQPVRVVTKEQVVNQRQFGWERPLTERDPNLSHWHWEPITNSYRTVRIKSIYGKPVRPLALRTQTPQTVQSKGTATLSGKLNDKPNHDVSANGRIVHQAPSPHIVATYGSSNRAVTVGSNESRARISLAGKILKKRTNEI